MSALLRLGLAPLAAVPLPVLAHPAHPGQWDGLAAGFAHPLLGPDHVAAMLALGLWASLAGRRALWSLPLAFQAGMVAGYVLAVSGIPLPAVEPAIAVSLVVLAILVLVANRLPPAFAAALAALLAVLHGHAHGTGIGGSASAFGLGFVAATALLHLAGIGIGRLLDGPRRLPLTRAAAGAVAAMGLVLLGGWA